MTQEPNHFAPLCAAADPLPRPPSFRIPSKACDTHAHIFGPQDCYPLVSNRAYTPPEARLEAYNSLLKTLGVERAVIVQPSVYGTDNRATLDAVSASDGRFRGVVVVDDDCSVEELLRLRQIGARGARVNLLFRSDAELGNLQRLAISLANARMHMQMLVDVSKVDGLYDLVSNLPVPIVFDHMGHIPAGLGINHPGFQALLRLLGDGKCWVKLSGSYRFTEQLDTPYDDVLPFARALVATNPDNLLWATDWPHPHIPLTMPNDGDLLNMLSDWVPNENTRNRILSDNPSRLYEFDEP